MENSEQTVHCSHKGMDIVSNNHQQQPELSIQGLGSAHFSVDVEQWALKVIQQIFAALLLNAQANFCNFMLHNKRISETTSLKYAI